MQVDFRRRVEREKVSGYVLDFYIVCRGVGIVVGVLKLELVVGGVSRFFQGDFVLVVFFFRYGFRVVYGKGSFKIDMVMDFKGQQLGVWDKRADCVEFVEVYFFCCISYYSVCCNRQYKYVCTCIRRNVYVCLEQLGYVLWFLNGE